MPSEKELEEYEKEYLKRHENQKKENSVTKTEEEKKEKKEVSKLLKNLDHADYTLLESQRTTNILLNFQLGFEKVLDSWKKLYRCGLVKKLERKLKGMKVD